MNSIGQGRRQCGVPGARSQLNDSGMEPLELHPSPDRGGLALCHSSAHGAKTMSTTDQDWWLTSELSSFRMARSCTLSNHTLYKSHAPLGCTSCYVSPLQPLHWTNTPVPCHRGPHHHPMPGNTGSSGLPQILRHQQPQSHKPQG